MVNTPRNGCALPTNHQFNDIIPDFFILLRPRIIQLVLFFCYPFFRQSKSKVVVVVVFSYTHSSTHIANFTWINLIRLFYKVIILSWDLTSCFNKDLSSVCLYWWNLYKEWLKTLHLIKTKITLRDANARQGRSQAFPKKLVFVKGAMPSLRALVGSQSWTGETASNETKKRAYAIGRHGNEGA